MRQYEHQLGYIESFTSLILDLGKEIKKTDFINLAVQVLDAVLGIERRSVERIHAEAGVKMEHFQNESLFSSWGQALYWNIKKVSIKNE